MPLLSRIVVALAGAVAPLLLAGCSLPSFLITPVSSSPKLEEATVQAGSSESKIAIIEVEGLLTNTRLGTGGLLGGEENKVSLFKQQLDAAAKDSRVKAVILRINSPGGTVAASDVMYQLVRDFKARTGKTVIAACQDITASGGYYVANAADEVHALPTSVVGSIGVIYETIDLSGLMEKIGVDITPVQSGPLKDMGSPFNGLSEEERAVMQAMVDEFYGRFVDIVREARQVESQEAFDGRVFTGQQAYKLGLVDTICHLPDSLNRARELVGAPKARVIIYRRPYGYRGSIYASSEELTPMAEESESAEWVAKLPIVSEVGQVMRPGFYYLWMP